MSLFNDYFKAVYAALNGDALFTGKVSESLSDITSFPMIWLEDGGSSDWSDKDYDGIEAVNAGFRDGEREAAAAGHPIKVAALLTAMRHAAKSAEIAKLAVSHTPCRQPTTETTTGACDGRFRERRSSRRASRLRHEPAG